MVFSKKPKCMFELLLRFVKLLVQLKQPPLAGSNQRVQLSD
jgi:hypothetical protein